MDRAGVRDDTLKTRHPSQRRGLSRSGPRGIWCCKLRADWPHVAETRVSRSTLPQAILIDVCSGAYVQVGMGAVMTQPVPLFQVIAKEIRVVGSFRYGPGDFKFAVALVERGLVDLRPLVTQRYSFENALEAFNTTRAGKDLDGNVCWFSFGRAVCRSLSGCYQMHHQWARIAYKVASPAAYLAHILISKCTIGTSLICIQPMLFQLSFANSGFTLQRPWWAGERPMLTRAQHQILCPEEQRVASITDSASSAVHCGQTRSEGRPTSAYVHEASIPGTRTARICHLCADYLVSEPDIRLTPRYSRTPKAKYSSDYLARKTDQPISDSPSSHVLQHGLGTADRQLTFVRRAPNRELISV